MISSRPIAADNPVEIEAIWRINQANVPELGSVTLAEMTDFAASAEHFRVIEEEGSPVAFLIVLLPSAAYDSPNFLWFRERYDDFLYVDRIAVSKEARRRGYGAILYRELFALAQSQEVTRITAEVNIDPPNEVSQKFHQRFGFAQVGEQVADSKRVAMLTSELPRGDDAVEG